MASDPLSERVARRAASGHAEDDLFALLNTCLQLETVQYEKRFHRGMTDALVAVQERMVLDEGERDGGSFRRQGGLGVLATSRHARLCHGGLQGTQIAHRGGARRLRDDTAVQF